MQTPTRLIAGALLWVAASGAFGLGFGRTTLTSALGQPLRFALTLRLQSGESVEPECVRAEVLSGDNRLAAGSVRTSLRGQTGEVGERAVLITTTSVIDEPIVTVNVSVGCPPNLSRSFVAFVDPPVLNLARSEPPRTAPAAPQADASQEPPAAAAPIARPRPARPPAAAASLPAPAARAASDAAEQAPGPPRPRPRAVAPSTPPSAPPATARRSSDPVISRNVAAPAGGGGARLQLESARLNARTASTATPAASAASAAAAAIARAAASAAVRASAPSVAQATPPSASAASAAGPSSISASAAAAAAVPSPAASSTATARAAASQSAASRAAAVVESAAPAVSLAASGANQSAALVNGTLPSDAERLRLKAVEDNLARLREDGLANQRTLLSIQAQLRESEASRYANPVVYVLALLCLLLAVALAWLIRQRGMERREANWWSTPDGDALRAAASQIMATGHGAVDDRVSRPSQLSPESRDALDTRPMETRAMETRPMDSRPSRLGAHAPVTEMTIPAVASPPAFVHTSSSMRGAAAAPEPPRREMSVEELIDLEQQVDFFVVLGQDESAIDLLLSHLRGSGADNPLPYLKLLDIYLSRGERDSYERIRERFNLRFNAVAPPFGDNASEGKGLEDYGPLLARLQFLWPDASQALEVLETSLFARNEAAVRFELPAYRDLLFLYALARDLAAREATGNVDVLLPFDDDDDFVDSSSSPLMTTMAVKPNPAAQRPLELDFDVSQPGAFDSSPTDVRQRSREYGSSGFGALADGAQGKPPKSSRT